MVMRLLTLGVIAAALLQGAQANEAPHATVAKVPQAAHKIFTEKGKGKHPEKQKEEHAERPVKKTHSSSGKKMDSVKKGNRGTPGQGFMDTKPFKASEGPEWATKVKNDFAADVAAANRRKAHKGHHKKEHKKEEAPQEQQKDQEETPEVMPHPDDAKRAKKEMGAFDNLPSFKFGGEELAISDTFAGPQKMKDLQKRIAEKKAAAKARKEHEHDKTGARSKGKRSEKSKKTRPQKKTHRGHGKN